MPQKARSHSQRQRKARKAVDDQAYNATQRKRGALAVAKTIRSSARWQRVRALKLQHDPVCEDPLQLHRDRTILARQVDHIIPLKHAPDQAFSMENLQSLCVYCHAQKSAEERKG